jgi:hypothetical protein
VDRSNPPVAGDIGAPPEIGAILRKACYDCHSNEVRWPWYAWVAPVSWLVARDVEEGREELNFSVWESYSKKKRERLLEEIIDQIDIGEMPPKIYLPMHPEARLGEEEIEAVREWVDRVGGDRPPEP